MLSAKIVTTSASSLWWWAKLWQFWLQSIHFSGHLDSPQLCYSCILNWLSRQVLSQYLHFYLQEWVEPQLWTSSLICPYTFIHPIWHLISIWHFSPHLWSLHACLPRCPAFCRQFLSSLHPASHFLSHLWLVRQEHYIYGDFFKSSIYLWSY